MPCILTLIISWWSSGIDPRSYWPAAFLGLLFPYLYISTFVIALIGLIIKKHQAWLLILLLIGFSNLFRKSFINFSVQDSSVLGITLLTHNIGSSIEGNRIGNWNYYHALNAEVLCFQEWVAGSPTVRTIKDSVEKYYPASTIQHKNLWPIFSKYPIIRQGEIKSSAKGNGCTWADLLFHQDTIRIYNVHLVSNRISAQTEQLMQVKELPDKNTWQKVTRVMKRYKQALLRRVNQADIIKKHMALSPYPLMLVGDFNDIPSSYVYHLMSKNMKDGFMQAGNGLAYTYAGRLPFLHIDHILISPGLHCVSYKIQKIHFSDHYPVMTRIQVKHK